MHTYFIGYVHVRGPEIAYGNTFATLRAPIDSEKAVHDLTAFLKKDTGLPNLTIVGIHPLKG